MWRALSSMFLVAALVGCGGSLAGGGGGSSGSAGSGSRETVSVPPGACSVPDGHIVPYATPADLESMLVGDWLRCRGNAYPGADGLRLSPDHTWTALKMDEDGRLHPIPTVPEGSDTWTAVEIYTDRIQVNLLHRGGGAGGFVAFTDTGQLRMDLGGVASDYVRLSGGGFAGGSGGGSGGTVSVPDAATCSVPDGQVVPYATVADLERMIVGDWLRCRGNAFPAEFGDALRISPDHTWNVLEMSGAGTGTLRPIDTGFDGYGAWTAGEIYAGRFQFNLHIIIGGGAGGFVTFTDTGQMRMDLIGIENDYVRFGQ